MDVLTHTVSSEGNKKTLEDSIKSEVSPNHEGKNKMIFSNNDKTLYDLLNRYSLSNQEKEELLNIIYPIYIHDEFQKRMTNEYLHHDEKVLGQHILEDTIATYILSKKECQNPKYRLDLAVTIAMLHDLYSLPWQNNPEAKVGIFTNKHGFRHPMEAAINSLIWYPYLFTQEEETKKILDGIIHHMFPLPVVRFIENDSNPLELKNFKYIRCLNERDKKILIDSSSRGSIGRLSFSPSIYTEGKIVNKADKLTSMMDFRGRNMISLPSLLTGKNKKLINNRRK